jgi:Conjugative transposon protein TcpC
VRKAKDQSEFRSGWQAPRILRGAGRAAIWAAVGVLIVRGGVALLAADQTTDVRTRVGGGDDVVAATADRFARLYLEDPSPAALTPFLAAGARIGAGRPPSAEGAEVAQADVLDTTDLSDGRVVVTVSCELRDSRTLLLTVPVVRQGADEAAVLGAPSIVAMPAPAGADPESPRPLAGPEAAAIRQLIAKFLPAYLSSASSRDLSYLLAPGVEVVPLGGELRLLSVGDADQLGDGEGARRVLVVKARVEEPEGGAAYPLAYRLQVLRRGGRWYVAAVEGAVA